jgi:hypothetical protein
MLGRLAHDHEGYRCRIGAWWAVLFLRRGWAMVAAQTVWFKREEDFERYQQDAWWRAHEHHHFVQERERFGGSTLRYVWAFAWEYARYGHDRAPLEIEANEAADQAMTNRD